MSLDQAFTSEQSARPATHVTIQSSTSRQVVIRLLEVVDDQATLIVEQKIEPGRIKCRDGRFTLISKAAYARLSSYEDGPYNPLVTAAYAVGTLGVGAPIARWYEYRLGLNQENELVVRRLEIDSGLLFLIYSRAAMADDWFVFAAVDPVNFSESSELTSGTVQKR